ncbi:hypothetical protein ABKN59_005303 [Abortiporus biennis]
MLSSRTTFGPKLPVELLDHIIDYMQDDRASLRAMSLVGHVVHNRSRRHLFHTICIRRDEAGYGDFIQFLQHNPTLASLVKELALEGTFPEAHIDTIELRTKLSSRVIWAILKLLPHLEILDISWIIFTSAIGTLLRSGTRPSPISLRKLRIRNMDIMEGTPHDLHEVDIVELLQMFSNIGELTLSMVRPQCIFLDYQDMLLKLPGYEVDKLLFNLSVQSLVLSPCDSIENTLLIGLMTRTPSVHTLRSIVVDLCLGDDLVALRALLGSTRALNSLAVHIRSLDAINTNEVIVDLSTLSNLTNLNITVPIESAQITKCLADTMATFLPGPPSREVTIGTYVSMRHTTNQETHYMFGRMDWSFLDIVFSNTVSLKKVTFDISQLDLVTTLLDDFSATAPIINVLREDLPCTVQRGLLTIITC